MKGNLYHVFIEDVQWPVEVFIPVEWDAYRCEALKDLNKDFMTMAIPENCDVKIKLTGEYVYDNNSPFTVHEILSMSGFEYPDFYKDSTLFDYINDIAINGRRFRVENESELQEFKKIIWNHFRVTGFKYIKLN